MPMAAKRPCPHPGCAARIERHERACPQHLAEQRKDQDQRRGSAASRGYGNRWRKARKKFLEANPLCAVCLEDGIVTAATNVDHIEPHKGNMNLFWDRKNWQALCHSCHSKKTATEDGGFGRKQGGGG